MEKADGHLHTLYSDGWATPEQQVLKLRKNGFKAGILTDHNTFAGTEEFIRLSKEQGIETIPGIEIQSRFLGDKIQVHVLGYGLDINNVALNRMLKKIRESYTRKTKKILDLYNKNGIYECSFDSLVNFVLKKTGGIMPAYVAADWICWKMADEKKASYEEAHQHKMPSGSCYLPNDEDVPTVFDAIARINKAGGVAGLAHLFSTAKKYSLIRLDHALKELVALVEKAKKEHNLRFLECYYPENSDEETFFLTELAEKNNLLMTGGSDDHGTAKTGKVIGNSYFDYGTFLKMKKMVQ